MGIMETGKRAAPVAVGNGDLTQRLDQAWRILGLNQELIRAADQKIYLLIVMSTLLVSYVATNIDKIMRMGAMQCVALLLFILASGCFYFFALSTLFPRRQADDGETERLIFFGDIASRPNAEDYIQHIRGIAIEQLFADLSRQIYRVAQVATGKYLAYGRAWRAIMAEVGLFVLLEFSMVI